MLAIVLVGGGDADADGAADDFEWLVPIHAPPLTLRQYAEDIVIDQITDETYVIWSDRLSHRYNTEPVTIHCSRYDPETMQLELVYSHRYLGYYSSP
ncbi:MAG: hypothetical protein KAQ96_10710, partial [Thermoplasmata archaeon]|nr:hypothetical protein [Thermoplasmata archaeon]